LKRLISTAGILFIFYAFYPKFHFVTEVWKLPLLHEMAIISPTLFVSES